MIGKVYFSIAEKLEMCPQDTDAPNNFCLLQIHDSNICMVYCDENSTEEKYTFHSEEKVLFDRLLS